MFKKITDLLKSFVLSRRALIIYSFFVLVGLIVIQFSLLASEQSNAVTCYKSSHPLNYQRCPTTFETVGNETCGEAAVRLGCYTTGTNISCFQANCTAYVKYTCNASSAQQVMNAYNYPNGLGCTDNPTNSNSVPGSFCGWWQIDCYYDPGCQGGYHFIGGFDTSGCAGTPVPTTPPVTTPPVTTPPVTTPPVTTPPITNPPGDNCPFSSTQVRVDEYPSQNGWDTSANIQCGERFIVGVFANGWGTLVNDTGVLGSNARTPRIRVTASGLDQTTNNNLTVFQTNSSNTDQTITVRGRVLNLQGDPYAESNCRDTIVFTCNGTNITQTPTPPVTTLVPGLQIFKDVAHTSYYTGEIVRFTITIRNTGQTTITTIPFRDQYNSYYLNLNRILNDSNADVTGQFSLVGGNPYSTVSNADVTNIIGDLAPGQTRHLYFEFTSLRTTGNTSTCNDAFIRLGSNGSEMGDNACLYIVPRTDL